MPYVGKTPVVGNFVKLDAIVTSATATYNLLNGGVAYFPQTANNCIVSLNGVIQSPTSAYTISGSTIIFDSALTSADSIDFILVLGDVLNIGTPSDSTVSFAKVTSNLITGATAETSIAGGDSVLIYDDSASALRKMTRTNFVSGLGGFDTQLLHVRDEKTANTSGGTFTSGSFQTRTLNTSVTNEISGASLSSNQITLPTGTYYIDAAAPAHQVNQHKAILKNITDSSNTLIGTSEFTAPGAAYTTSSFVTGRFTIASSKTFELQHRCGTTGTTTGFGYASNFSIIEVYTDVKIWKVA
jgi:hypothetical protein